MKYIDLHIHSTASDGTCSPSELIDLAEKLDLAAVALTDHDTVAGLPEFMEKAESSSVTAVPGVEVAVNWNYKELHILGLWVQKDCSELNILLKEIRDNRHARNDKIIGRLQENGYNIAIDEVKEAAGGESVGRPHLAAILVKKGYFKTIKDVFSTCLARGGTGYVGRILPDIETAISTIHKAGGITFWAHPVHRSRSNTKDILSDLKHFKSLGLDGIEGYYSEFSKAQHEMLLKYAKDLNMAVCGGSDFHGGNQPDILLGKGRGNLSVPESVYDDLCKYLIQPARQRQ
jgi:3',5'-nucleoside bisphosphate phosphatase